MDLPGALVHAGDFAMRETALFAAAGFLVLGAGDLAIDLIWIGRTLRRRLTVYRRHPRACAGNLPAPTRPGRIALFVPAWDEAGVIGGMLRHALAVLEHPDWRIYVGCYPNDPATIAAVKAVADPRLRLVVAPGPGPTTKADCLNRIWDAMKADEGDDGVRVKAVVLHDAEDVVHSSELRVFETLIERFDLVQLPVLPLLDPASRWIAGHYADEFAEAHGKELVVREAVGAGLPSAGVGCAISREALAELADRQGSPFDADSLTEDYELGLKLRALGRRAAFVRIRREPGAPLVATREHFPATIEEAVAQKARWMTGIALSGWDRLGWSGGFAERWMRMRDRQSLFAALLLVAAYAALVLWSALLVLELFTGVGPAPLSPVLRLMLTINAGLLLWRLAMRFGFVASVYGWREGLRSIPRVFVANAIAMLAARRAIGRYLRIRKTGKATWDKTAHAFPLQVPAE